MPILRARAEVYRGWSTLYRAEVDLGDGTSLTHEVEDHGSAAGVLPYDPVRRTVLLVRQLRTPVLCEGGSDSFLLEAPAGRIDTDEAPETTARREALEEAGVRLGTLQSVGKPFSMPAISTERLHLYLAPYAEADRISAGGGLAEEQENIEVVEMPISKVSELLEAGQLPDMKTMVLLLWLRTYQPQLFT